MKMKLDPEHLDYMVDIAKAVDSDNLELLLELKEDRWITKMKDASDVIVSAMLMPEDQMDTYDRGGYKKIGVPLERVTSFAAGSAIGMEMEDRTLKLRDGSGATASLATVNPGHIMSVENTPPIDYEVTIKGNLEVLTDFIDRAEDVTGTDNYMVGVREEGMYLYMEGDNSKMDQLVEWDDDKIKSCDMDWSVNNLADADTALVPKKDEGIDVILANDFTRQINNHSDEAIINLANHHPMRVVYDNLGDKKGDSIKISYFQMPRISSDWGTIPDGVLK